MNTPYHLRRCTEFDNAQIRIALLTAAALFLEAFLAKSVLGLRLDFVSQFAALWVLLGFQVGGRHGRIAERAAATAVVLVTAGVLLVYAL